MALDAALEVLEASSGRLLEVLAAAEDSEAAVRRQQLEALTLLVLAEPALPAPAGLRARLLANLRGDETQVVPELHDADELRTAVIPPGALRPAAPRGGDTSLLDPVLPPASPAAPAAAERARSRVPPPAARPARRWAWPLAAVLTLVALALGTAAGWLWRELDAAQTRLARSEQVRERLRAELAAATRTLSAEEALQVEAAAMREQLGLVTAATTEVCALRPPASVQVAPQARGLLYVAADHQHWYLRAEGLAPPGEGRAYHLWFLVGDQPVSVGRFELQGEEAVLTSPTMPLGTTAAVVTVEPVGTSPDRPSGPVVLYGNQMIRLL